MYVDITFLFTPALWIQARSDFSELFVSVIGDEILKGQVIDSNSHFLCRRLFTLGVDVKKVGTYSVVYVEVKLNSFVKL